MKNKINNIYEINTRVWLRELSLKYNKEIKLNNVSDNEIEEIKNLGFDTIWLISSKIHAQAQLLSIPGKTIYHSNTWIFPNGGL